jgi:type IV fimbrial biogenesis protein FimT
MRSNNNVNGQTLFELTATLLIIGLTSALAIPLLSNIQESTDARSAINRMVNATQQARTLALTQRRNITLCPSLNPPACSSNWSDPLILLSESGDGPDRHVAMLGSIPAVSRGKMHWRSFRKNNAIKIQSNGMTAAYNGTFIYCPKSQNARFARALVINKSGRARLATDLDGDGIVDISEKETISCPVKNR